MSPRAILVTGATSGIGRHAALALARDGDLVFAAGRNAASLASLARDGEGTGLVPLELDVTEADSIARAAAFVAARTAQRGVDAIVNNAGYGQAGAVLELTDAQVRAQFETNVFGLLAVTRAFSGPMIARRSGRIVNVSSIGGRITFPMVGAYHASKYAVEALSDAMRAELRPLGVEVVIVEPGPIATAWNGTAVGTTADTGSPWDAVRRRAKGVMNLSERVAVGPEATTRAIRKALDARWPRARYVAPAWLGPFLGLLRAVPTPLLDFVYQRVFGLDAAGGAPATGRPG